MATNPTIRRIPRDKLLAVFKTPELVRLFEDVLYGVGQTLPANITIAQEAAEGAQGSADDALASAALAQQTINEHIIDATAAHAASAIELTPTGGVATDVQSWASQRPLPSDFATNLDYVAACRALATPANFAQNGALIHRLMDRVFIGGAIDNDGAFPNVEKDWLSTHQSALSPRRVIGVAGTGVTTAGSPIVTFTAGGSVPTVGSYFFGRYGIPAGAKVQSVDSATQITLDVNANAPSTTGNTFLSNNATTLNGSGINASTFGLINDANSSAIGALYGSRSLNFTTAGQSCIGLMGVAKNDNATLSTNAWALYLEGQRLNNTVGSTYGMEASLLSTAASEIKPTSFTQTATALIQASAGCGLAGEIPSGVQVNVGAMLQIAANPVSFRVGIVFGNNAIEGTDGVTGTATAVSGVATAISMAPGHAIETYNSSDDLVSRIYTSNKEAATKTELRFINSGVQIVGATGQPLLLVNHTASAVNYLQLVAAATGNPAQVFATGTDANIDLRLRTTGTGVVRFGAVTANADAPITGYKLTKNDDGTTCKLAVIA